MRAVLMSIKPEWWKKILAGEKTVEIRKTAPKGGAGEPKPWPLLVLVYVSGTGAVLGQFYCHGWAKSDFWPMSYAMGYSAPATPPTAVVPHKSLWLAQFSTVSP